MTRGNELRGLVLESEGGPAPLASYLRDRPLVVLLLRHFGCPVCREQLHLGQRMLAEVRERGADMIAVVHSSGAQAAAFARQEQVDLTVLGDPDQRLYRLLGMKRGNLFEVTLKPLLLRPITGLRRMTRIGRPGRDIRQLGGVAIIDAAGVLRWCYRADDSGDIPSNRQVLEALADIGC